LLFGHSVSRIEKISTQRKIMQTQNETRNNNRRVLQRAFGCAIGIALIVTLAACGGGGSTDTEAASDDATEVDAASKVIQVAMTDNVFTLSESTAKVGQEIEFVVVNNGAAVHNMVFDGTEFASASMINPGDTSSFKATFTEAGVYKFICVFHMPAMVGEITVED
jgi:plastocyanin